jgi:hypothetical protein
MRRFSVVHSMNLIAIINWHSFFSGRALHGWFSGCRSLLMVAFESGSKLSSIGSFVCSQLIRSKLLNVSELLESGAEVSVGQALFLWAKVMQHQTGIANLRGWLKYLRLV